ncbi:hypothetical protein GOD17_18390 [Sinorhizobium medicae]|uniref:hypothetical protein n=1 Tax=Rhizobium meliloti TaxID=382 RepID=UPI00237EFAE6|nr:hypothetical protein [Sinorhizobium meliloti]MDE3810461.1 hypothetical protein [Sinorhizobium meliloti]MDX0597175.1 hypothetical protein [Sinorhizobium medicae]
MSDWQIGEPPLGREIEYERDGRSVERGSLALAGKFGMGGTAAGAQARMKQQYMRVNVTEMFEVTRWRELE